MRTRIFAAISHALLWGACGAFHLVQSQVAPEWTQLDGPFGANVVYIAENPSSGNLWIYASNDKLYMSDDGGETWSPRGLGGEKVYAIAFRSDGYVFTRRHRSPNNGLMWAEMRLPDGVSFKGLAVDESTGNVIASASDGLYYSTDSGLSWSLGIELVGGAQTRELYAIGSGYVFAITRENTRRILRSTDAGVTWEDKSQPLGGLHLSTLSIGRDNTIYLGTYSSDGSGHVYASVDLADTWEEEAGPYVRCRISVVKGTDSMGRTYVQNGGSLYRLEEDFRGCKIVFDTYRPRREESSSGFWTVINDAFVDSRDQVFVASGYGGFFRSLDGGESWTLLQMSGVKGTTVTAVSKDERTETILAGTRRNGIFRSFDHGQTWEYLGFLEKSITGISPGANTGQWFVATRAYGLFISEDNGESWSLRPNPLHKAAILDFTHDRSSNTLFVRHPVALNMYYSRDEGITWEESPIPNNAGEHLRFLSIAQGNAGYMYVCVQEDVDDPNTSLRIYRTPDFGVTWEEIPHLLSDAIGERPAALIFVDKNNRLWTAVEPETDDGKLYYTDDLGLSWALSIERPRFDFEAFLETPDGSIWIATYDEGILRSTDRGLLWQQANDGLQHPRTRFLAWDPEFQNIVAGTEGGGLYQAHVDVTWTGIWPDASEMLEDNPTLNNYPNPFNPSTTISYSLPRPSDVQLEVFDLLGKRVLTLDSGFKPSGQHEVILDASGLPSGVYFYSLQAGDFTQTRKMVVVK